jgi:hypothetical protein
MSSQYLDQIEASYQPLDFDFHPIRDNLLVAALVDGSVEIHDFQKKVHGNSPSQKSAASIDEKDDEEVESLLSSLSLHTQRIPSSSPGIANIEDISTTTEAACKCVAFSVDGTKLFSGGSAGDLIAVDAERACTFSLDLQWQKQILWNIQPATEGNYNPITVIKPFEHNLSLLATGDDSGGIRLWDQRICKSWSPGLSSSSSATATNTSGGNKEQPNKTKAKLQHQSNQRPPGCVLSWKEQDDYISAIQQSTDNGEHTLLATSADCRLGVYDLRMNRDKTHTPNFRLSDDQEDELLSLQIMKYGKKVVCGTQEGALSIFSWGTWGDCSDRFPGHPRSIDALLKVDEDTLLTGSSDGQIRVVQIQPDKVLGKIGDDHHGFPIEKLGFNSNRNVVGSLTHNNFVRLWDAKILLGDSDDDDSDDESDDQRLDCSSPADTAHNTPTTKKTTNSTDHNSDDDWDDMDNRKEGDSDNTSDDDSDESDSDSDEPVTVNEKRKKRLKTDNENFFADL